MSKQIDNPLYLFGIVEESDAFKGWKENATPEYKEYRRQWMNRTKHHQHGEYPLSLNIEITRKCNLACTFCWHRDLEDDLKINMDLNMFKDVIDESSRCGLPAVNLNGLGEPMLHPDLFEMIRYCKDAGIQEVMFHTNGTIMTERHARELIHSGLDLIIFSLDSPDKTTYEGMRINASFDAVQKNVELFLKVKAELGSVKPFVRTTMVLTEETYTQVPAFASKWSGKVDSITVQDLLFASNSDVGSDDPKKFKGKEKSRISICKEDVMRYIKEEDVKYVCPYLFQSLKIHPSGAISACSPQEAPSVGELHEGIQSVWSNSKMSSIRSKHLAGNWQEVPECSRCDVPYMEIAREIENARKAKDTSPEEQ